MQPTPAERKEPRADRAMETPGFLLLDSTFSPKFMNPQALAVLTFDDGSKNGHSNGGYAAERFRPVFSKLMKEQQGGGTARIQSGRRRYSCSMYVLEPAANNPQGPMIAILLERTARLINSEVTVGFSFTQRERQVVQLLALGLTTKEIANRLEISPNTVKTFLRLVMAKTEVTTRSGIVGKLLQNFQE